MRFLVDECTGPSVAKWLRDEGHDVFSVYAEKRGASDNEIIQQAHSEDRILITADKDFGENKSTGHPRSKKKSDQKPDIGLSITGLGILCCRRSAST